MALHPRRDPFTAPSVADEDRLYWPFCHFDGIDSDDIRETAYEVFFTACRSSPGFGGRNAISFYSDHRDGDGGGGGGGAGPTGAQPGGGAVVVMTPTSRIKRALGLKMLKRSPSRRMSMAGGGGGGGGGGGSGSGGSAPGSPSLLPHYGSGGNSPAGIGFNTVPLPARPRRPLTSAEIMRIQMRVTEQSDSRLRKTLMRTLVGQAGKRAETIVLPLELLRHLKPSEFNDSKEYHMWQRRQLKILEAGLLIHPSIPPNNANAFASRFRDILRASETKAMDTSKNSDAMRTLCNSVVSLSWRSTNGAASDVCHWADGFPLNVHLYVCLLQSIFDFRDETLVLDEVDELVELMKKTWSTLGISKPIHNLCFTWVLFQQYVLTGQVEPDLLYATQTMLSTDVANDAKKTDREAVYVKLLSSMLASMQEWAEKRLLHYHDHVSQRGNGVLIENLMPLALSASNLLGDEVTITEGAGKHKGDTKIIDSSGDRVNHYIRSSVKNAFTKVIETGSYRSTNEEARDEASEALLQLAKETENLALKERECFSPILKKWNSTAAGVAAVSLHFCYGTVLKQYLSGISTINSEVVEVLQKAGKLEKVLVQMVVEDAVECEDGGKSIVQEMIPYEVDSVMLKLTREWIEGKLKRGKDCVKQARDAETWNPKSKNEPYAQSAVELVKIAKEVIDEFFQSSIGITDGLLYDLASGLEHLFKEYANVVVTCGSKQSYLPTLPPLTRCNRDSKFFKLWKKATPCSVNTYDLRQVGVNDAHHPRPSTSRGTQRLYIRLNTLHYLLSHMHSLDKTLVLAPRTTPTRSPQNHHHRRGHNNASYFELPIATIQSAAQCVSEVAAYRLIFLDSNSVFYESLYVGDVANSRIMPVLRILKQNLSLMSAILTDRAQALALREVLKASFEAFLMVLLAGGGSRVFQRSDHSMIVEDFESLKRIFCTCAEGLITEDFVDREAEVVEGVIGLMGECTQQLMEDFIILTCETSRLGIIGSGQKLPMPPTTGRWNRTDPNTILRVLCYRKDKEANLFLKKTFQLAKRR